MFLGQYSSDFEIQVDTEGETAAARPSMREDALDVSYS